MGKLSVTLGGMSTRDEIVFDACARAGVPLVVVMSGGYARDVRDTVTIHAQTVVGATRLTSEGAWR